MDCVHNRYEEKEASLLDALTVERANIRCVMKHIYEIRHFNYETTYDPKTNAIHLKHFCKLTSRF